MKRFRNFLLVFLNIISCICFTIGLSACSNDNNTENTQDKDILAIYNMYVAYAEENNTTPLSYSDWLLTIKGEKGDKGEQGIQGVQGEQGIQGEKGEKGDTGEKGEQGPAGINGTNGKDGVNGTNGKDGINGTNGADGQNGKSAYEIWLDNGHTGNESDFLNWLKGSDGVDGQNGKDGLGIKNAKINDDGDLIITFDNDTTLNAGNVVNPNIKLNDNNKITFNTLEVTGNNVYGKVSNETDTFSFIKEINLIGNAGYTVYTDLQGTNPIPTKTVSLKIGDNIFYVLESCGNDSNLYTITIRRKPIYTVSFVTNKDNISVETQFIEEDSLAVNPEAIQIDGYETTWDYNFNTPIVNDITITAIWKSIFTVTDNSITGLTDYGKTLSIINIPESIDGQSITKIKYFAFSDNSILKKVIVSDSITTIGSSAFDGCSALTSLTIGKGVTDISYFAFNNCTALTEIKYNATECIISDTEGRFANSGTNGVGIKVTIGANVKIIPSCLFLSSSTSNSIAPQPVNITEIIFEENSICSSIGESAFRGIGIKSIILPETITDIGKSAFYGCESLENITIPNNVSNIGICTFYGCKSLEKITIPNNISTIGENAFGECERLKTIYYNGDENSWINIVGVGVSRLMGCNTYYKYIYFNGELLEDINLTNASAIPKSAFSRCYNLKNVRIGNTVTSIENNAFYYCYNLTSVTITNSVTSIGDYAFRNCKNLKYINFAGSIDEWYAIEKGYYWHEFVDSNITITCTDGTITL